jgi:hypothetical protein
MGTYCRNVSLDTHLFFALPFTALVLFSEPLERALMMRRQSLALVALESYHALKLLFLLRPKACPRLFGWRRFAARAPSKWRAWDRF